MKYAVLADIHANLPAFQAVIEDSIGAGCSHFAILGDFVNYGKAPRECLDQVSRLNALCVQGNHDLACSHEPSDLRYAPSVERMFLSTSRQLRPEQRDWLRNLPLVRQTDEFTLVHANLVDPAGWGYIFDSKGAAESLARQTTRLCFFGHTHLQQAFAGPDATPLNFSGRLRLERDRKYLVNVGSVGFPRDPDGRASYCIFDSAHDFLEFRRVSICESMPNLAASRIPSSASTVGGWDQRLVSCHAEQFSEKSSRQSSLPSSLGVLPDPG